MTSDLLQDSTGVSTPRSITPMTIVAPLHAAKRALRSKVKGILKTLPAEHIRAQSDTILKTVLSLPEYQNARSLSIYLSMPKGEVTTGALVTASLEAGKEVFVPYIHRQPPSHPAVSSASLAASASGPPSLMDMLSLSSLADFQGFKPDSWGIPTIPEEGRLERKDGLKEGLDLIIMPGVAFSEEFKRCGHGKGFYDYFLTRYNEARQAEEAKEEEASGVEISEVRQRKMPILVALALKEQMVEEVPTDLSDWYMDVVVTGDGRCLRREV
ncbi:hypothetical protein BZA77DRAFT_311220 [Pyronema omphalodes]|nr:hypothetical protein BZA77DRAFT_311220 [Pyronema omphalodes]